MPVGRPPRDTRTLDLFDDWQPPEVVHRFDDHMVRAANLKNKISLAVAETLKGSELTREAISDAMVDWLGEGMSKNLLDAYASQAREEHVISLLRLIALIHATGDLRILQMIAELFDHSVVDDRYLPWIEVGQLAERKDEFDRAFDAARRHARARCRS
jgi:hypothetical protein